MRRSVTVRVQQYNQAVSLTHVADKYFEGNEAEHYT